MRPAIAAACLLLLTACGSDTGTNSAADPSGQSSSTAADPMPSSIPAADGPVAGFGTVIDQADGPALCLGPIAESYPPQCDGIPLDGWVWQEHAGQFDNAGGTRFGSFLVTGTFDGTTMTYDSAVSGALYDPARTPEPTGTSTTSHTQAQLDATSSDLRELPGMLSTSTGDNVVVVDVVNDDGSLQAWVDQAYDAGLVVARSTLVAVGQQ